jgi:hypothetical protein
MSRNGRVPTLTMTEQKPKKKKTDEDGDFIIEDPNPAQEDEGDFILEPVGKRKKSKKSNTF